MPRHRCQIAPNRECDACEIDAIEGPWQDGLDPVDRSYHPDAAGMADRAADLWEVSLYR